MTLDEEILSEQRLDENQELMLYNMSLRQTSQRAAGGREGTHLLLSRIENDPTYQEMIERGLLECRLYGHGGGAESAAASLIVTRKGLRYCVLYADEIEPRRAYDVAGAQRFPQSEREEESRFASSDEFNYAILTSGLATGSSAAKDAAVALSKEQVERLEELGAKRRGRPLASPTSWTGRAADAASGNNVVAITPEMTFSGFSVDSVSVGLTKRQVEQCGEIGAWRKSLGRPEGESRPSDTAGARELAEVNEDVWMYAAIDGTSVKIVGVSSVTRVLRVPGTIDGYKVVAIAANALSANDAVVEIVCPDSIESIGEGAFRLNQNLRRLVLPANVAQFKSSWIDRCSNLEELVLPGLVDTISRGMLESKKLSRLVVGRGARVIEPGIFQDANLSEVTIDEANPFIETDGIAIYTKDGSELIALARPVDSLAIADGCERLARKSCCGFAQLHEVTFPETLVEIGPFAFSRSGIECFDAPASLRIVDEKAFFGCANLREASLNDGLEDVGDSAFEGSAIGGLSIPASIRKLGKSITRGTGVVHSGPERTLTIAEGCADLFLDGAGGLYRKHDDGIHLVQLVDDDVESYDVYDGAVAIDPHAFAYHDRIRTVRVADTVRSIGRSAFRVCKNLASVTLPDTVASIGDEAFLDTNIEEFRVPAALTELGERALVTYGAHHGAKMPSLARIEVAPGNKGFYVACGMLCRRTASGASVVAFTSSEPRVVFPEEVTHVEEYAFCNARGIEYLSLNPRLSTIGTNGMATRCWIRHIHVELPRPLEGRTAFDFFFPNTPGAVRGISLGLSGASWVNVPGIMEQLDLCLMNARDYNVPGKSDNISAYAQAKLILDRLDDPVMLKPRNKSMMERVLRDNVVDICVDVALYDDRSVLDDLIERGFVNADNLDEVIERVGSLRDAATSAYLLEAKRERFARNTFDYDL